MKALTLVAAMACCTCCAAQHYRETDAGRFEGKLMLQWEAPDRFAYTPDPDAPLRFIRSNGDVIEPKHMPTDGGSIPRPFWGVPGYSPWAFGPAFVIHDWLFYAHTQQTPGHRQYTFEESATILSECIKTLMESRDDVQIDKDILYNIHLAVTSDIARDIWNRPSPPTERPSPLEP